LSTPFDPEPVEGVRVIRVTTALAFVAAVTAGSVTDRPLATAPDHPTVLAADFHVHGMPGDGALPVWEIQREAARRAIDVVAITNHDDNLSMRLARASGLLESYPLVIPGQEVTAATFHIAAIGVNRVVDSALSARDVIEAIHGQGGVAIAAHPVPRSWTDGDERALTVLDGAEVFHPALLVRPSAAGEMAAFLERARRVNPGIAPIGSTDFHVGAPLGLCRTYLIVDEVSEAGVLDAIRRGRTVANRPGGELAGAAEHVAIVQAHLKPPQPVNFHTRAAWPAAAALLSLGIFVLTDRKP
jgi:hypothetical protein